MNQTITALVERIQTGEPLLTVYDDYITLVRSGLMTEEDAYLRDAFNTAYQQQVDTTIKEM